MKYNLDTTTLRLNMPDEAFDNQGSDAYALLHELENNPHYYVRIDNPHDQSDWNTPILYPENRFGYDMPPINGIKAIREYIQPYDRTTAPHLPTELHHTVIQEQTYPDRVASGLLRQVSLRTNQYNITAPVIADYELNPEHPVRITYGGFEGEIREPRLRVYDHTERWRIGRIAISGSVRLEDDICIQRTARSMFHNQQNSWKKWRARHFIQQMALAAYLYEIDQINHEAFDR